MLRFRLLGFNFLTFIDSSKFKSAVTVIADFITIYYLKLHPEISKAISGCLEGYITTFASLRKMIIENKL